MYKRALLNVNTVACSSAVCGKRALLDVNTAQYYLLFNVIM